MVGILEGTMSRFDIRQTTLFHLPGEIVKNLAKFSLSVLRDAPRSAGELYLKATGQERFIPATRLEKLVLGKEPLERPKGIFPTGLAILGALPILPTGKKQVAKEVAEEVGEKVIKKLPSAIDKLIDILKAAKPLRRTQKTLVAAEKGKRITKALAVGKEIAGEKGFYAELGALKGKLPKVSFEAIRGKISQPDIDTLFDSIKKSPVISDWDKVSARKGLAKLFGEFGGGVPTEGEISLLGKVFPEELTRTILSKRPLLSRIGEAINQIANIPRSVMASFDLSAPLRQGLFTIRRKQFWGSFKSMFKSFGSERAFKEVQESIVRKPTYELMKDSKLHLTEMGSVLGKREEAFMSQLAEKIPLAGRVVRASGRAHVAFLNKLRADIFEDMVSKASVIGRKPLRDLDLTSKMANYINAATGRGSLGAFERIAVPLNTALFSPRLMASRLKLLNPLTYIQNDPFVRKEALKDLFALTGLVGTTLGLAKLGGADVETNTNSADWGKIRIGDTRLDIMGGFQQYIRSASQLLSGKFISTTTGKEVTLGEGYKPLTKYDILLRQIEAKEAPLLSFVTDMLKQRDYTGKPIKVTTELAERLTPMVIGDLVDLAKNNPSLLPLGALGIFGVGIQTYPFKEATNRFNF